MRLLAVALVLITSPAVAQDCRNGQCFAPSSTPVQTVPDVRAYNLAPGETLVAVDGVPVGSTPLPALSAPVNGLLPYEINRDQRAYAHAKREAQILASRGTAGHPLGCAPGTRYSGTGYSYSGRPNHCYYGELSETRLVARACVRGRNGALFWSAHYR